MSAIALLTVERLRSGVTYIPLGDEYWADPYPMYRSLRNRDPFHRSLLTKTWVLTGYDDVAAVLRDDRLTVDIRKLPSYPVPAPEAGRPAGEMTSMLTLDPPDHTRLRGLVSRAFSARSIQTLRPRVEAVVDELLDAVAGQGEMDLIRDLAGPLPIIVIGEMFGIPEEDRSQFTAWAEEMVLAVGYRAPDQVRRSSEALRHMNGYLEGVIAERKRTSGDDLLSALLAAEAEGDKLSPDEVLSTSRLLINAGYVTTTHAIGNGLLALLQRRDQWEMLCADRSLIEGAAEELLRYDSPAQATSRYAPEALALCGQRVEARQQVVVVLGAANRDPTRFADPDRLDITRKENHHLSFGLGIHFCLGAPLARLELQAVLAALTERFPNLGLAGDDVDRGNHMLIRGLNALPVTF